MPIDLYASLLRTRTYEILTEVNVRTSDASADLNSLGHCAMEKKPLETGLVQVGPSVRARVPELDLNALVHLISVHQDRGSFAHLYNWLAPRLTALGLQFGVGPDSASELAQKTMLKVWRRAQTFDPGRSTLSTWVYTVMRDTRVELAGRPNHAFEAADTADFLLDDHIVSAFSRKPISDVLIGEMATLPSEEQRVAAKQFFENNSHSVIAEEFSLALETIQLWSKKALERLQPVLMEPATP